MLENTEGAIKKLTIQRNWQQDEDKQNKNTTHYFTEENTNNVNKT
jgi:hypothetical protein